MSWASLKFETLQTDTLKKLDNYSDPGESLAHQVLVIYLQDAPKLLEKIANASSTMQLIHEAAHGLKSISANVGALGLAEICQNLEDATDPENKSDATLVGQYRSQLQTEFSRVMHEAQSLAGEIQKTLASKTGKTA